MEESNLNESVREFIQSYIPTAGSLETLLFLFDGKQKAWSAEAIAAELRSNRKMVEDFMAYFQSKGLVVKYADQTYQLNPETNLIVRVAELRRTYTEKPVSILNEIYRNPMRPGSKIQLFADAFKIKKDEKS